MGLLCAYFLQLLDALKRAQLSSAVPHAIRSWKPSQRSWTTPPSRSWPSWEVRLRACRSRFAEPGSGEAETDGDETDVRFFGVHLYSWSFVRGLCETYNKVQFPGLFVDGERVR